LTMINILPVRGKMVAFVWYHGDGSMERGDNW